MASGVDQFAEQQTECRPPKEKARSAAKVFDRLTVDQVARRRLARSNPRLAESERASTTSETIQQHAGTNQIHLYTFMVAGGQAM
jgi:hypothetical protein